MKLKSVETVNIEVQIRADVGKCLWVFFWLIVYLSL